MDDVYLEGDTPEGQAVVGHLSVIVDTEGITFLGPEPGERRTVGWERTSPLEFGPPAALPGGEQVTSLEFAVDGRPLRLLVPSKKDPHTDHEPQTAEESARDSAQHTEAVEDGAPSDQVTPVAEASETELAEVSETELAEPPAAILAEVPDSLGLVEASAPVLAEPPAPVLAEPRAPVLAEPPQPILAEPPAPILAEPPEPVPAEPPAPVLAEPPAPVLAEPPAPVLAEPPAPVLAEPAVPVGVVDDTIVVAGSKDEVWTTDDDSAPTRPPAWFRYAPRRPRDTRKRELTRAQSMVRLVLFTVLAGLIPIAAGARYFQLQGAAAAHITGVGLSDAAIAARVGIQAGDLPGWSADAPRMGNAFAVGATTQGAAALNTAEQASTVMARCLHVPVSAVDGAFGMGSAVTQRTAEVTSPSYADPAGNGGAVNSVVDVVKTPAIGEADASVFQNPGLFATCYQPFVQAMLPYAPGAGTAGFATATVQPIIVPVPDGPAPVTVAGFQIARIANDNGQTKTVVSTATAVFDGRVQATLGTVSGLVFSLDAQDQLVRDVEIRTVGVGEL
jgi:hypothetical protein